MARALSDARRRDATRGRCDAYISLPLSSSVSVRSLSLRSVSLAPSLSSSPPRSTHRTRSLSLSLSRLSYPLPHCRTNRVSATCPPFDGSTLPHPTAPPRCCAARTCITSRVYTRGYGYACARRTGALFVVAGLAGEHGPVALSFFILRTRRPLHPSSLATKPGASIMLARRRQREETLKDLDERGGGGEVARPVGPLLA